MKAIELIRQLSMFSNLKGNVCLGDEKDHTNVLFVIRHEDDLLVPTCYLRTSDWYDLETQIASRYLASEINHESTEHLYETLDNHGITPDDVEHFYSEEESVKYKAYLDNRKSDPVMVSDIVEIVKNLCHNDMGLINAVTEELLIDDTDEMKGDE